MVVKFWMGQRSVDDMHREFLGGNVLVLHQLFEPFHDFRIFRGKIVAFAHVLFQVIKLVHPLPEFDQLPVVLADDRVRPGGMPVVGEMPEQGVAVRRLPASGFAELVKG